MLSSFAQIIDIMSICTRDGGIMTLTYREVCGALGVDKNTVDKYLRQYGLYDDYVKRDPEDGRSTRLIDEYAVSVLASKLGSKVKPKSGEKKSKQRRDGDADADSRDSSPLIDALNAHIADLQKVLDEKTAEIERRENEYRREIDARDREINDLREKLDAAIDAERRASGTLQRVAGAGLWQRIAGFKGLLGDGSNS